MVLNNGGSDLTKQSTRKVSYDLVREERGLVTTKSVSRHKEFVGAKASDVMVLPTCRTPP